MNQKEKLSNLRIRLDSTLKDQLDAVANQQRWKLQAIIEGLVEWFVLQPPDVRATIVKVQDDPAHANRLQPEEPKAISRDRNVIVERGRKPRRR